MKYKKYLLLLAVVCTVILMQKGTASAATIDVSGSCSIDNAIISTNNDADSGGCVGTGAYGDDTINIPAGTWTLTSSTVTTSNITFQGSGVGQTIIDGDNQYYAFVCDGTAETYDMNVYDMTITRTDRFQPTEAIFSAISGVNCNLDAKNVEITDTIGFGGIDMTASKSNQSFQVKAENVYIHDNSANGGIAIAVDGSSGAVSDTTIDVMVSDVTISGNALHPDGMYFAGIFFNDKWSNNNTYNISVINTTITSNDGPSVGMLVVSDASPATVNLQNSTIVGNDISPLPFAGGIAGMTGSGSLHVNLQNNLMANGTNCATIMGAVTFTSLGNNLADDSSCGLAASGDQQNLASLASTLGPLQDNGGVVPTMALLAGSPAIDAGATLGAVTTDARGVARPQGSAYDVGAFELEQDENSGSGNSGGNNGGSNSNSSGGSAGSDDQSEGSQAGAANGKLANTGAYVMASTGLALLISTLTLITYKLRPKIRKYILARA